jgi:hypothetical protein
MDGAITLSEGDALPTDSGPFMTTANVPPFQPGRSAAVEFEIIDYRLAIRVDGSEVLTSSSDPKSPAYYAPNITALRKSPAESTAPSPRIYAEQGSFEVTHLAVDRDVYYYHDSRVGPVPSLDGRTWVGKQIVLSAA